MKSVKLFQIVSTFTLLTLLCTIALSQSETPKTEVGIHYTGLRFGSFDNIGPGVGVRATRNLNDNLAVEGEINFFPQSRAEYVNRAIDEERFQGLFGVKAGFRRSRFGAFIKARPGFIRVTAIDLVKPGANFEDRTLFNFDVGGVFEFYPLDHFLLRADIGDTFIRLVRRYPETPEINRVRGVLQISVGVGYRF
ncbi:MAG: hypothetical protein JMDDDDMK_02743 [Acidobacteria bacterium]|nr:hypothetical protein [Acidobacteriota bacterium]